MVEVISIEPSMRNISPFSRMLIDRIPTMREWRIEFHWIFRYLIWSRGGSNSTTYKTALEGTYLHPLDSKRPLLAIFWVITERVNTITITLFFWHLIDMKPKRERYIKFSSVIKIHKRESGEEASITSTYRAVIEETILHPIYFRRWFLLILGSTAEELNIRLISPYSRHLISHLIDRIPTMRERTQTFVELL